MVKSVDSTTGPDEERQSPEFDAVLEKFSIDGVAKEFVCFVFFKVPGRIGEGRIPPPYVLYMVDY